MTPYVRWYIAACFGLVGCHLAGCSPSPVAPKPGFSCEHACDHLAEAGCREAKQGPTVTRADGTTREGVTCVRLCDMLIADYLPQAQVFECAAHSDTREEMIVCGMCK